MHAANGSTESHSASGCLLNPFRIPSPFDGTEVFRCKFDVRRSEVFVKAMQLGCARNRNDPRLLGKQPSKRELSRCHLPLFREFAEQINQRLVRFTVLWVKAWDGVAEIRIIELRIFSDLAGEETFTKWAKWNESDPEFFQRRQHQFFRLPPPERVLALKCGDRLNRVCATDRLRSCFRKAEVLNLTLLNELLHRSGHFFDRHVQIDTMLVKQIDRIHLEPLERRLRDLPDVLRATI